ncbi:MAG TPA: hypothetical protein DEV81_25780 [Cyanobacteria bacterium UBA11049]|nr:hypothetical protein [Cyanobacteria bacterium UBA11049]
MKQKNTQAANAYGGAKPIATKIKKWVETAKQLRTENIIFALPITRLTSIKSLCQDEIAAEHFALYLSKQVQKQTKDASCPSNLSPSEWEIHKTLIADAIAIKERYIENPTYEGKQSLQRLLRQIDELQGDDFRNVHWTTVHFVKSGYLLKLEYAIRCFTERDFPYYAYKLAREYTESYEPRYGSGLIPESVPRLLEVAEFWCNYYFGQNLNQKFPQLMEKG